MFHKSLNNCKRKKVCYSSLLPSCFHDWLKNLLTKSQHFSHINFIVEGEGWRSQVRFNHALGNNLTHWCHWNTLDFTIWCYVIRDFFQFFNLSRRFDAIVFDIFRKQGQNILLHDFTTMTGSLDFLPSNVMFEGNSFCKWRNANHVCVFISFHVFFVDTTVCT
ncbi:Uncharacterised protein [Streptococcus pneumoniae]|nr:Uncharacterised protein [Streptococcus pneumoniae]COH28273.1 Uncharacterised protein [Streptococcus pneumoniae]